MTKRLTIRGLEITGDGLDSAAVSLKPGLNLIIGASDTGKTFILEAIDFMFGAKGGLRRIPESTGYTSVSLKVDPSDGAPLTLRRAFDGGNIELQEFTHGRDVPPTETRNLSSVHSADPGTSLSAYLLHLVGFGNPQVRKNVQGDKKALSFRHVVNLFMIGEERIIQQSSPVLSEHDTEHTAEANVFAYLLTGQDDAAVIPQESAKNRRARLGAETTLLEGILGERRSELAELAPDPATLQDQVERLESAIREATSLVVSSQAEISGFEERRAELSSERTRRRSRMLFLEEQLKRLRLLDEYYKTDRARLEAVVEASRVFHDLPQGTCPLCKQSLSPELGAVPAHSTFEEACQGEIAKIDRLGRDLGVALADFVDEENACRREVDEIERTVRSIDEDLRRVLMPTSGTAQADLQRLIQARTTVAQGTTLQATIHDLESRLARVQQAQAERVARPVFEPRASTSSASEFCKIVEDILTAWKYPDLGPVAFDTEKCDLVIGGKDRGDTGKGYRAITYAAFAIGLMKYCRLKGIPHPGIVVLDTPLNPYKGPASPAGDDQLADEVKLAFFDYLASDESGDQVIVMENVEPPTEVRDRAVYYYFTRNPTLGRYGFFPPVPASGQE